MDNLKILYVEDEADIREVAAFALEDEGFELLFCASGEEALRKSGTFRPDLVLMDVMMPGMDGPTTLQHLREIPGHENIPVIFLTAKVQPDEIEKFRSMGVAEVIAKPFDPMRLAEQIRALWNSARGQ